MLESYFNLLLIESLILFVRTFGPLIFSNIEHVLPAERWIINYDLNKSAWKEQKTFIKHKNNTVTETHLTLPFHPADFLLHQQLQEPLRAKRLGASLPAGQDPDRVPLTGRHDATGGLGWLAAHSHCCQLVAMQSLGWERERAEVHSEYTRGGGPRARVTPPHKPAQTLTKIDEN